MTHTPNVVAAIRKRVFGLSQKSFAEVIGVDQATVSRWEASGQFPNFDRVQQVRTKAAELGKPIPHDWFFTPPPDEPEAA